MKIIFILIFFITIITQAAKVLPPAFGLYHGAYADFGPLASDVKVESIKKFETHAGKKIAWAYFANDWIDGKINFPLSNVEALEKRLQFPIFE